MVIRLLFRVFRWTVPTVVWVTMMFLLLLRPSQTESLTIVPVEIAAATTSTFDQVRPHRMKWRSTTVSTSPTILDERILLTILSVKPATTRSIGMSDNDNDNVEGKMTMTSLPIVSFSTTGATTKDFQKDQVVRVLDANTIKLQKNGIVTLAGVRMPTPGISNFQFPDCFTYSPAYKLRQLVPANTLVLVRIAAGNNNNNNNPQAIVVRNDDFLVVNLELLKSGFGKVQKISNQDLQPYLEISTLQLLNTKARDEGLGIFTRCEDRYSVVAEAEFEPLEATVETQWGEDGGKLVLREREKTQGIPPANPGDTKGCSDFATYEDALRWYEYYEPYYGDVAQLDRDGDGVPCPGLPHTKVAVQYRMKVPQAVR